MVINLPKTAKENYNAGSVCLVERQRHDGAASRNKLDIAPTHLCEQGPRQKSVHDGIESQKPPLYIFASAYAKCPPI